MTSVRKIRANRQNARASTGPKTVQGRARAARNAYCHALSLPVCSDPGLFEEVEALAQEIARLGANAEIRELAHRIAEAQIDLRRVRFARHQLMCRALNDPHYDSRASVKIKFALIRRQLNGKGPEISLPTLGHYLNSTPAGPQKLATIIFDETNKLNALERYERRALSRRKVAIRKLDLARQTSVR